ncbi:unnamed protein product [Cercopithifilaria johnstoni]|uniref:LIM zinc-binding domain-containing protein n=1 Tax=Cercopithifilaria johnstoni TaxID=2874296 RepID=A0A8J2Q9B1_9BILA|nr:unnamed protein product [Cercopithifilaria johnstoni]
MSTQEKQQESGNNADKCYKCGESINDEPGCTALGQAFHMKCFTCKECNKELGGSFYNVGGQPLCEDDYVKTLEQCTNCDKPIKRGKMLRARGSSYHAECFVCTVCNKCLDDVPFSADSANNIHCVKCFHEKSTPRCSICSKQFMPDKDDEESDRIVAMAKNFHVNCYRCEDCHVQLNSEIEGQGCYPLDEHLYCKNCNSKRLKALSKES